MALQSGCTNSENCPRIKFLFGKTEGAEINVDFVNSEKISDFFYTKFHFDTENFF